MLQEVARITYCSFFYCQMSESPDVGVLRGKQNCTDDCGQAAQDPPHIQRKLLWENKEK